MELKTDVCPVVMPGVAHFSISTDTRGI